jgi:hypothetical protein
MNCPHCNFHFEILVTNVAEIPDLAPIVWEDCIEVCLIVNGKIQKMTPEQLEIVQTSPAWESLIKPAIIVLRANKRARNAQNN